MKIQVVIPFRLREGADMRRAANLEVVQAWWYTHGMEAAIVDDGLEGDAQFNRHRAYNRAVAKFPETDVFVFSEADMLIHPDQIRAACEEAHKRLGLVVPFTQYRYWSDETTARLRDVYADSSTEELAVYFDKPMYFDEITGTAKHRGDSIFKVEAESTKEDGTSIGAVNVVSKQTLLLTGGFTEATSGNWYDDNIIEEGFAHITGNKTRFIDGPAVHLYHLPGWTGEHLSKADRDATRRNKTILVRMRSDIRMRQTHAVRALMRVRR